jgi:hypothetical protein
MSKVRLGQKLLERKWNENYVEICIGNYCKTFNITFSAINRSFGLVFLVFFFQNLTNCSYLDENAFTKQTSVRKFGCVLYFAIWLPRKWWHLCSGRKNCFRNKVEFWSFCEFYDVFLFKNPKIKILPFLTVIPVVSTSICLCEALGKSLCCLCLKPPLYIVILICSVFLAFAYCKVAPCSAQTR